MIQTYFDDEYIQKQIRIIESFNYKVLEYVKIKNKKQVLLECTNGHQYTTTIKSFVYFKKRCPKCNQTNNITTESVKKYLNNINYILLSEYAPFPAKLKIQCDKGHTIQMTWKSIKNGSICRVCSKEIINNKTIDYWNKNSTVGINHTNTNRFNIALSEGYKLIENDTIYSKLCCPNGHIWKTIWQSFKSGTRCPECVGNKAHSIEEIKCALQQSGYSFISKNGPLITIKCPNNHIYTISRFRNFTIGDRCKICSGFFRSIDDIKNDLVDSGLTLLTSIYKNNNQLLKLQCKDGHFFERKWQSLKYSKGCPACLTSGAEIEIKNYLLKAINITNIIERDRYLLNGKELDIYIPEHKIAIEYCGLWYHAVNGPNVLDPLYHYNKWKACEKLGIVLLTIFEDEWLHDKLKTEQKIKSYFNGSFSLPNDDIFTHDRRYPIPFKLRDTISLVKELSPEHMLVKGSKRYKTESKISKLEIYDCGYDVYKRITNA